MNEPDSVLLPHGGYERLRSYQIAEAVYDATVVFCNRFIDRKSRTHDQMVQAARSGVRNISEGSGAAATSRKSEMLLTNVARASLSDELAKDYKSFLIQNGLRVWHKDSPEAKVVREILKHDVALNVPLAEHGVPRLTGLAGLSQYIAHTDCESATNAMLCAVNQAAYLLRRQVESQARDFKEKGGFTERLYATRIQAREQQEMPLRGGQSDQSDKSDPSDQSDSQEAPACPECGKPMRKRMAKRGQNAGSEFWGCTAYPACTGTRNIKG